MVTQRLQVDGLDELCPMSESLEKNVVVDQRTCHLLRIEMKAIALYFTATHRERRNKMPEQTMNGV